jgi:ribosomal protein S12 methylthiotransferase accessory factor
LSRGEPRLIPAHRVFLGPSPHAQQPGLPDAPIVSGFACAASFAEAARRGLLEVLERDAFMLAWAHRLPLARLDADSLDEARPHLEAFGGVQARCLELRLEHGLPFVLAMFRSERPGDAAAGVASAADTERSTAARRALCELAMVHQTLREALARHRGPLPDPRQPEKVVEMHDHALLYARPDMLPVLEPWWTSPPVALGSPSGAPEDPAPEPSSLVERLAALDLEVLVVDLTRPEIRELGLRVVKVLVPGTYPMNFDSRWPQFGGRRMVEAPVKAGLLERPTPFEKLNRIPHPFP